MLLVCSPPLSAHVGNRLIPISYLSKETLALIDLDDGVVEDWEDVLGEPVLTTLDFDLWSPDYKGYQFDPSNLDFRIWLGWSEDGKIYFAGQFVDDRYIVISDHFYIHFSDRGDSIALRVDGDHSGGRYLPFGPEEMAQEEAALEEGLPMMANMQAQEYEAVSSVPEGPRVTLPETNLLSGWWMVMPPFARDGGSVFGENPTFWSIEFFITCFDRLNHLDPEDSAVSRLSEGKVIGLDIWVHDHDEDYDGKPKTASAKFFLNRPDSEYPDWNDAGGFVDGLLLGPNGESRDSAVEPRYLGPHQGIAGNRSSQRGILSRQ